MVVFATVGYGDNYAHNTQEYIFFMMCELSGVSVFAILMKMAQGFMADKQRDIMKEKVEEFEVWLLGLHRYSKRSKVLKANDLQQI